MSRLPSLALIERIYTRLGAAPGAMEWTQGECWLWPGSCSGGKYDEDHGRPSISWSWRGKQRCVYVARALLSHHLGRPLRAGMVAAHTCDNYRCVNPYHLNEASSSQNLRDAWARGRRGREPVMFAAPPSASDMEAEDDK